MVGSVVVSVRVAVREAILALFRPVVEGPFLSFGCRGVMDGPRVARVRCGCACV